MKVGVVGAGAVALAMAAWLARGGHGVRMWSPRAQRSSGSVVADLSVSGVIEAQLQVCLDADLSSLVGLSEVVLIAVPVNAHRSVMDALLPHLRSGLKVVVSSMASLSALYLYERACARGCAITVASFGTTVFTARREAPMQVRVMTRRAELGVSSLPCASQASVLALCQTLFGEGFRADANAMVTTLSNVNPIAHGPLALFNWTRIERAEAWPQYHYMTPRVAAVIMRLEAERLALVQAFGLQVRGIEQHLAQSFGAQSHGLEAIAAELHAKRGGPPGPVDVNTRYLAEDMPFGLVFLLALGERVGVPMPATAAIVASASLITGNDFHTQNDLIDTLALQRESAHGLMARVNA